jgi:hypothetical protein
VIERLWLLAERRRTYVSRWTREPRYNLWARELAHAAHAAFTHRGRDGLRMAWKMSIDLSRPLVPSMGHHDPLDGFVTLTQLKATGLGLPGAPFEPRLDKDLLALSAMNEGRGLVTVDPLGLGGLLIDACRVHQLMGEGELSDGRLLEALLAAALAGLAYFAPRLDLGEPPSRRLAFREIGLAIGLRAIGLLDGGGPGRSCRTKEGATLRGRLAELTPYASLADDIVSFWLEAENRRGAVWSEHRDINEVMLAASLVPSGYLLLRPIDRGVG